MYPHRIRLRGPWEATVGERATQLHLPRDWNEFVSVAAAEVVRLRRHFGAPRLDADERAWIDIWHARPKHIAFNKRTIEIADRPFEITSDLLERNELELGLIATPGSECPEIALEIRGRAYLESLRVGALNPLCYMVYGKVVDLAASARLELHVLADGRPVVYRELRGSPEGTDFEVEIVKDPDAAPPRRGSPTWRVELIEGPQIWHRADFDEG